MPTFQTFATRFARCLDLFRDPGARADQKTEFRAILGLLADAAVTLRVTEGRLEVNGVVCQGQEVAGLLQRLDLLGISEIALSQSPPAPQLFELFRVLAEPPGTDDVPSRLQAAGADRVRVSLASGAGTSPPPPTGPPPAGAPPEEYRAGESMMPSPDIAGDRKSGSLGTDGILRGDSWRDIQSVPIAGVPLVTHDPPPPPPASALPGETAAPPPAPPTRPPPTAPPRPLTLGSEELSLSMEPRRGGRTSGATPAPQPAPTPPPEPVAPAPAATTAPPSPPAAPAPAAAAAGTLPALPADIAATLAELEQNPGAPNVGDVLAALLRHVESALTHNRLEQLLAIVVGIAHSEQRVSEASGVRRQYAIALKRIYTKPVLEALARLIGAPKHRANAVTALQRGGADAVEVLMDLLVAAPTVGERRAVFDALRHMTEGTEQLVHMLDHPEWFVARNVAELIGELGMEDAVPALARQLGHADERVRKAVALALAKIGTRSAAEPLRRALRDKSAEVRMQVALGIGGRKSFGLAMPLVVAMQEEADETVERELILALGRIGSPDAVQALIKFAQPAGRFFGRKPSGRRVAAVEALRLAGTPAAIGTLEGLAGDGDRQVRSAARAALEELKRKPRA